MSDLVEKWGKENLKEGWVAIPSSLLFIQKELGITPLGMNIIQNLVLHWWKKEDSPFPSQEMMAKRMGVSTRSIQREIKDMTKKGLIYKSKKNGSRLNEYNLAPLVEALKDKKWR